MDSATVWQILSFGAIIIGVMGPIVGLHLYIRFTEHPHGSSFFHRRKADTDLPAQQHRP